DIEHLREIRRLTQELGVNLAGVEEIMRLRQELEALQERFESEVERLRQALQDEAAKIESLPALPGEAEEEERVAPSERPVYVISVAAELVDMHPQTLRLYERKGLIRPKRSSGKTRLYSERDIEHLREIRRLTQELGINLAGVEEIMRLRQELEALQERFESEIGRLRLELLSKVAGETPPAGEGETSASGT
ncbi:MAG TPA: MerR family transcriptional regulator, partial [Oceanithermus profundus]|nr:MerR family transcriptional regulator [Oceanithermus profundus]